MSEHRTGQGAVAHVAELMVAVTLVVGAAVMFWRWSSPGGSQGVAATSSIGSDSARQMLEDRLRLGRADAPAVMVIFSDFQCPYCARFATTTLPEVRRTLVDTGRLAVYFRHLPVDGHLMAAPAAELAECAGTKHKFWPVHDLLFAANTRLNEEVFNDASRLLGLPEWKPGVCDAENLTRVIEGDRRWAEKMGVTGTPYFIFGSRGAEGMVQFKSSLSGTRPAQDFYKAVESLGDAPR